MDETTSFLKSSEKYSGFYEQYISYNQMYPIPFFQKSSRVGLTHRCINSRDVVDFSSYNYLSLSGDARLNQASTDAAERFGTSAGASRVVSGECTVHSELENSIADLLKVDASLTFVGGHATNVSVIGHVMDEDDLILMDMLAHNSIIEGARLSRAKVVMFRHNNVDSLRALLKRYAHLHKRALIVVEGVYSMEGDIANLPQIIEVKKEFNAGLMVDEAHSMGVLGATGCGIREHFDIKASDVDIWMGTLSKSFGSCGGYIAGSDELITFLRYTCSGFVYSVGLPPPAAAAALTAIKVMHEEPKRIANLNKSANYFRSLVLQAGFDISTSSKTPIVPIILYSDEYALVATKVLQDGGVNVFPIIYPAVKKRQARLRFFINSSHTKVQIERAVALLVKVKKYNPHEETRKLESTVVN